jgi:hypothetical protein
MCNCKLVIVQNDFLPYRAGNELAQGFKRKTKKKMER